MLPSAWAPIVSSNHSVGWQKKGEGVLTHVSITLRPLPTWYYSKLTLISFLFGTFWPPADFANTNPVFDLACKRIRQTSHFWRESFSSLSIRLLRTLTPDWAPKYCIRCLAPNSALVWLPPRFLWIYKELASIMNSLLNYWLLFTSLAFTVPFPPCFLSSITCPALTYLPVHLFRAFLTPLHSPLRPSCQSERGRESWSKGGRWKDW